jgi:hypothetical protein
MFFWSQTGWPQWARLGGVRLLLFDEPGDVSASLDC